MLFLQCIIHVKSDSPTLSNLTATYKSPSTVLLEWMFSDPFIGDTMYTVYYQSGGVSYNTSFTLTEDQRSYLVMDLPLEVINPRRACAAKVTLLGPSVCLSASQCVHDYSRTAGNEGASERYQQLQRNKRSKIKKAILLKRRRSRSRNWHYSGPRWVTQPMN